MRNGVNDREKLEFALQPSEITFRAQAAWWLSELASGRLKSRQKNKRGQRIRVTTLDAYTTAVACLNEKIGDGTLATFDNGEMKELVSEPPVVDQDDLSRGNTALLCSSVTVAELWHGARQTEHKILDALFAAIQCVPIDLEIARQAGEYLRQF